MLTCFVTYIVIHHNVSKQVSHFNYLGRNYFFYESDEDMAIKVNRFHRISGNKNIKSCRKDYTR